MLPLATTGQTTMADYTWIPLVGSHRTVGDALAALEGVRKMAAVYKREYATSPAEDEQS